MDIHIEIDDNSGFCFGVTTAISKAEEELMRKNELYCLGDIVHNDIECERLKTHGLKVINQQDFLSLHNERVLFRAHGEPPQTYETAKRNDLEIIDATCPVVLRLQQRIRKEYEQHPESQIVIFGKKGHAEVLGLMGQTNGKAVIIDKPEDVEQLDFKHDIRLFSQTTKPLSEFQYIVGYIEKHMISPATFRYYDTICRQVANRMPNMLKFADRMDAVLFVSGRKSSNGLTLFKACQNVNPKTYMVEGPEEIQFEWFENISSLGICGATSTPKWLMEACKDAILNH